MSQKTDKMLKLALVFFISLLSFSIGTFVGKKYSDNQHKLASLEPHTKTDEGAPQEFATEEKHEGGGEHAAVTETKKEGDVALTDHEVAKIAEEFATDSNEADTATEKNVKTAESEEKDIKEIAATPMKKATPATVATKPAAVAEVKHTETTLVAPTPAKHEMVQKEVVTHEAPPAAARAVASIPPAAKQYTVQVASFATAAEAQKLTQDLLNKGFKSSFVTAQVNGQTWHRVQVGLFGSVKEAQDYKKDFLEKTHLTSAIVQPVKR